MDSGRIFFNPSSCNGGHDNMLLLGNGNSLFQGAVINTEEASKRRPFFTSPDELFDEDYYDEQLPEKKRRLTPEQVHMLEKSFETENKLEPERKTQLAKKLGLQPRQVAVWFQNRRARWKTKQLERDYDLLKTSFDKLQSDYNSILKDNENLKSEVASLAEKLQSKSVEAPISDQKADQPPVDRLSSITGESAIAGEDGRQLVDSCNSYLPNHDFGPPCTGPADKVQSAENEGSDNDAHNHFTEVFIMNYQNQEEEEPLGWWVWS